MQIGLGVLVLLGILHLDEKVALGVRNSLKHHFLELHNICTAEYVVIRISYVLRPLFILTQL